MDEVSQKHLSTPCKCIQGGEEEKYEDILEDYSNATQVVATVSGTAIQEAAVGDPSGAQVCLGKLYHPTPKIKPSVCLSAQDC